MKIEDTKIVVEETDYDITNDYIKKGWSLINHYVVNISENHQPDQKIRYVLAWQHLDIEPTYPDFSFHAEKLKITEEMVESMISEN